MARAFQVKQKTFLLVSRVLLFKENSENISEIIFKRDKKKINVDEHVRPTYVVL